MNLTVDYLKCLDITKFVVVFMSTAIRLEYWIKPTLTWIASWILSRVIGETIISYILETEMCELYLVSRLHIDNM